MCSGLSLDYKIQSLTDSVVVAGFGGREVLDWQTCQVLQEIFTTLNFQTGKKHDLEGLAAQQKWPWRLLDEFAAVFQAF